MGLREKIDRRIEEKRNEVVSLQQKINHFQGAINAAKIYIQALEDTIRLMPKEPEAGIEATLRPGTILYKVREILATNGSPMHITDLLKALGKPNDNTNRAAVSGSISAYFRKGQIFTRPAPNTFGLMEYPVKAAQPPTPVTTVQAGPPENFGRDDENLGEIEEIEEPEIPWEADAPREEI